MNKLVYSFLFLFCFSINSLFSQPNLIMNGSFENYLPPCPGASPNSAFNNVLDWWLPLPVLTLGTPHPDLYCGGTNYVECNPGPVPFVGAEGVAYAGFHTRIFVPNYNECILQWLATPLVAGNPYTISFSLMDCNTGIFTAGPSDFCVYTNVDTAVHACPATDSSVVLVGCIPYDSIATLAWKKHEFSFIAPPNSNVIIFSGAGCFTTEVYYYLDNIILKADSTSGVAEGHAYDKPGFTVNPLSTYTTYRFNYIAGNNYVLLIYNATGQLVRRYDQIQNASLTVSRDDLSSGLFFYQLIGGNKIIDKGKLVVN